MVFTRDGHPGQKTIFISDKKFFSHQVETAHGAMSIVQPPCVRHTSCFSPQTLFLLRPLGTQIWQSQNISQPTKRHHINYQNKQDTRELSLESQANGPIAIFCVSLLVSVCMSKNISVSMRYCV